MRRPLLAPFPAAAPISTSLLVLALLLVLFRPSCNAVPQSALTLTWHDLARRFFYDENGELVQSSGDPETPLSVDVPTSTVLSLAAGNGASVLLGGFGGAGLVPQTVLNLNSGGQGQISIASYAFSMVLFALVLAPFVGQISVPALAGIMVQVSLDTIQFKPTFEAFKNVADDKDGSAKVKLGILIVTAVLCYQVDFAVGTWGSNPGGLWLRESLAQVLVEKVQMWTAASLWL